MNMLNSYFADSYSGGHLSINEDCVIADVSNELFGIVDAYGGSGIGDITAELIKKTILESYGILSADENATLPLYFNPNYSIETNALINSLKLAHSTIKDRNKGKDTSSRGAASFIGCILGEKRLQLVGTGNCLALSVRKGEVSLSYTPDSNLALPLTGKGNANNYPFSGLGLFDSLEFYVREVPILKGDYLILLSSGTYAPFNLTELAILLKEHVGDFQLLKTELHQLSVARGAKGNQSIVCLEF